MSVKLKCHSNWNVTQIEMSLKLESHWNWNVTQILMSLKLEDLIDWNGCKSLKPLKKLILIWFFGKGFSNYNALFLNSHGYIWSSGWILSALFRFSKPWCVPSVSGRVEKNQGRQKPLPWTEHFRLGHYFERPLVNWIPKEVPRPKPCGPEGLGRETSPWDSIHHLHPRLFHILSFFGLPD